jgi:hypothetical protein
MSANLTPEERARVLIDAQLTQAGWSVQDRKQIDLVNHTGVAVRETILKNVAGSNSISPRAIYGIFIKSAARQILTGHLLALRFHPLLRMKEIVQKPDMAGLWDKEFKFYNNETGISLTTFTALNYKMLTEWLESSPSQVLAAIEGVSPSTIRNRLNSAREAGVIGKPGSGKRSSYEANLGGKK